MEASVGTLLLFNGITGAVADVALNDLSRWNNFAKLRPYFASRSISHAAASAALTVLVGAAAVVGATAIAFGYAMPRSAAQVGLTLGVSFVVGVAMDIAIDRLGVFSGLEAYYAAYGAGAWGGLSLVTSMAISLLVQVYVLPSLRP